MIQTDNSLYFIGDVKRWRTFDDVNQIGVTKDGVLWDISAATLYLERPDQTLLAPKAGVKEATGIFHADGLAADLNVKGQWRRYWVVTDGTVTETWGDLTFFVRQMGAPS